MTDYLPREIARRLDRALRHLPILVLSGLRAFLDRTPACTAAVLAFNGRQAAKLEERLWVIPLGHLLG